MNTEGFELYATSETVIAVDGSVKRHILHMLQERSMGFDEIVAASGKVKSTISKHLKDLEDDGLITSFPDKKDKRKKRYVMEATTLGRSTKKEARFEARTLGDIATSVDRPADFINAFLRSIRYRFDSLGIEVAPMLYQLGKDIGEVIGEKMEATDLDSAIVEIGTFWEEHNMGKIEVMEKEPLTFIVTDCYECGNMPDVGKTLCGFDEGIIEAILFSRLKKSFRAKEVECWGTGYTHCKYVVVPLKS